MRETTANPSSLPSTETNELSERRAPSLRGGEPIELRTPDGALLRGELLLPEGQEPVGAVALSHAMMVDRRTLDLPRGAGLLSELARAGLAVLWTDQRGHGQSGAPPLLGARWDYDDLVADAGLLAAWLARRFPSLPRIAMGHSLFGHVSLAYQARASAQGGPRFDCLALLAANTWVRRWEPLPGRWLLKRAVYEAMLLGGSVLRRGYLPVRALGAGTADEAIEYLAQMGDWTRRGDWADRQGRSYSADLRHVTVPILSVVGAGDRLLAVPACQLRLLAEVAGPVTHWVVGRRFGDASDPDHMGLVLDTRLRPRWQAIAAWVAARAVELGRASCRSAAARADRR